MRYKKIRRSGPTLERDDFETLFTCNRRHNKLGWARRSEAIGWGRSRAGKVAGTAWHGTEHQSQHQQQPPHHLHFPRSTGRGKRGADTTETTENLCRRVLTHHDLIHNRPRHSAAVTALCASRNSVA